MVTGQNIDYDSDVHFQMPVLAVCSDLIIFSFFKWLAHAKTINCVYFCRI